MMKMGLIRMGLAVAMVLSVAGPLSADDGKFGIYNIVPSIRGFEERTAEEMAEYHRLTGEDTVLLSLPCQPEGKPAMAKIDRHVESYRRFAAACRRIDPGLKVGVLIQSVLGHFVDDEIVRVREDWQRSVLLDGRVFRWCALDPAFRAYIKETARRLAAEGPCLVMTDDDIRAIGGECCCPLHAAELNRRTGKALSPGEWRAAIAAAKPGDAVHDEYMKLQRETFVGINRLVREGVDEVDPGIPACICMGGEEYRFAAQHARAIAAKGQRPMFRLSNSLYLENQRGEYPWQEVLTRSLSHMAVNEFEECDIIDEADTWPQNLWSKSGVSYFSHMTAAAMMGMVGAKVWCVNATLRDGSKTPCVYMETMARRKGYLNALTASLRGTRQVGIVTPAIVKASEWHAGRPRTDGQTFPRPVVNWNEQVFSHFGFPVMASRDFGREGVWELAGDGANSVDRLTDAEIRQLLAHRVIIDGQAALALAKRGFADLIGADVSAKLPPANCEHYGENDENAGRYVKNDGGPTFVPKEGARVFSWLCFNDPDKGVERVSPGSVVFKNALGGSVGLTAYNPKGIFYNLYNGARKRFLERFLSELNGAPLDGVVRDEHEVSTLVRESADGRILFVMVRNGGYDPMKTLTVACAARPQKVERLKDDGVWQTLDFVWEDGAFVVFCEIPCLDAAVVRITRPEPERHPAK